VKKIIFAFILILFLGGCTNEVSNKEVKNDKQIESNQTIEDDLKLEDVEGRPTVSPNLEDLAEVEGDLLTTKFANGNPVIYKVIVAKDPTQPAGPDNEIIYEVTKEVYDKMMPGLFYKPEEYRE
jgi:hypothetical protein